MLLRIVIDGSAIDRLVQSSSADRDLAATALEALLENMVEAESG